VLIAPDIGQSSASCNFRSISPRTTPSPAALDGIEDQLARRQARVIDAQLSRLNQRHVQKVVDQTVHPAGGSQDAVRSVSGSGARARRRGVSSPSPA